MTSSILGKRSACEISTPPLHHLTMKKVYIEQIRRGEKTIEGRIFERSVPKFKVGDHLRFWYYTRPSDSVTCEITDIKKFATFKELLRSTDYKQCIPASGSLEEAVSAYQKIPKYPEKEKKSGVVAIFLKVLEKL